MQESRTELIESGSSTTGSTEHGDDVDSASVTTSSSSEVTAAAVARDRDCDVGPAGHAVGAGARPKYSAPSAGPRPPVSRTQDPLGADFVSSRPTYSKNYRAARDNDGFVDDELNVRSAHDKQRRVPSQQQQQQQQQQLQAGRGADTRTHCVSVDLHSPPREMFCLDTGNVSMI